MAEQLGARYSDFRYANLAVRGSTLDQIVADQLPVAERLRPDLISFFPDGNDLVALTCDIDDLARRFDDALGRIAATGATFVTFTGFDPHRMPQPVRWLRRRVACFNELIPRQRRTARSLVVDLWGMTLTMAAESPTPRSRPTGSASSERGPIEAPRGAMKVRGRLGRLRPRRNGD
jgi:hypothetical protein